MRIALALPGIRSTYNVGSILRTADGLGVERVICSGVTPSPLNPHLLPHLIYKHNRQIAKTALGAEKTVPQIWCDDLPKLLREYQAQHYQIIGLENHLPPNRQVFKLGSPALLGRLKEKAVLVLGEEVVGIPPKYFDLVDFFVEIPMVGEKESFNVSVAVGIALYALKVAF